MAVFANCLGPPQLQWPSGAPFCGEIGVFPLRWSLCENVPSFIKSLDSHPCRLFHSSINTKPLKGLRRGGVLCSPQSLCRGAGCATRRDSPKREDDVMMEGTGVCFMMAGREGGRAWPWSCSLISFMAMENSNRSIRPSLVRSAKDLGEE